MREFDTGATRDTDENKLDFDGFLSPLVLHRYAEYLNKHRKQADGKFRDSDNWQKGIPLAVYMKSAFRHFFYWWAYHRKTNIVIKEDIEESLCGLLFNAMGYLHEHLKGDYNVLEIDKPKFKAGDEVTLKPRSSAALWIRERCRETNYSGTYVSADNAKPYGHEVCVNGNGYNIYFFDDEIFPVEDN